MTGAPIVDWILGILASLATILGILVGAKKTLVEAKSLKQPPPTPYSELADRVTDLEAKEAERDAKIDSLRTQVRRLAGVLTREVHTLITWHESGSNPPPPDHEVTVIKSVIHELADD